MPLSKKTPVPDAWDDDWEIQADRAAAAEPEPVPSEPAQAQQLSKKERLARHAEDNRKLWEIACVFFWGGSLFLSVF